MKKSVLTLAVLASLMTACSDDAQFDNNTDAATNQGISREDSINRVLEEDGYVISSRVFAITSDKFIDGVTNVKHSSDTTYVDVNNDLLTKLNIGTLKAGDVIDVWESVENLPYIRVVDEVTTLSNGMTRCTTHAGDMSNLFDAMEMKFNTTPYSDPSKRSASTRAGGLSESQMVSAENTEQFREGKVVHPAVYYERDAQTNELTYHMAENVVEEATRASGSINVLDKKYPINWSKKIDDGKLEFGIDNGKLEARVDVEISININWKWLVWKSYVEEYKTRFIGTANLDLPLYVKGNVKKEWSKSETIAELPSFHKVFMVGYLPVEVTIAQCIEYDAKLKLEAGFDAKLPVHADMSLAAGPYYKNGNWSPLLDFKHNYSLGFDQMQVKGDGSAKAEAGIYYKVSARVYSLAGPTLAVGPKASAEASAHIETKGADMKTNISTKGKISVAGKVGAEVKVLKWDLGKYEKPFTLYEKELWNKSATVEGNFINGDFKTKFQ